MTLLSDVPEIRIGRQLTVSDLMQRLTECVREHAQMTNAKIKTLEDRITDLEGHAEHGPDGECGVCAPETVGPEEYVQGVAVSEFTGWCAGETCWENIVPGDQIVQNEQGMWVHNDCR